MHYQYDNSHALDRAYERYFMCLDNDDLDDIVEVIQCGRAKYLGIDWPTNSKWLVWFYGEPMKVVYQGREKRICTFLPLRNTSSFTPFVVA